MHVKRIQKIIDWIKADSGEHFRIDTFVDYLDPTREDVPEGYKQGLKALGVRNPTKYLECNTTFCIAGYANILRLEEDGLSRGSIADLRNAVTNETKAAMWLGLSPYSTALDLFYFVNNYMPRFQFDRLPADVRAKVAVSVLENLIKTEKVDWDAALKEHCTVKQLRGK